MPTLLIAVAIGALAVALYRFTTRAGHLASALTDYLAGDLRKMVERQAAEINAFTTRLDAAYKELESTNARLKENAFKDDVTGLYNRRFFLLRLEEEISRFQRLQHPLSVVFFHLVGLDYLDIVDVEDVEREFAQILMKHTRGINVVARYDGSRFAVLLVETSETGGSLYVDRMREVIARHRFPQGVQITVRTGAASLPDGEAETAADLLVEADTSLSGPPVRSCS